MSTDKSTDPYQILGVEPTASDAEIRSAYRKLAKQFHPDLNPGKPEAEARFKAIGTAYALLSDAEKRKRYDLGEIDGTGAERHGGEQSQGAGGADWTRRYYRDFSDHPARDKYRPQSTFDDEFLHDLFAETIGERSGGAHPGSGFRRRGANIHATLSIDFMTAANGDKRRLALPNGQTIDVTIPAGIADGQSLRVKGQGMPGSDDGPPGDVIIRISVTPHPLFRREGNDILLDLPVSLKEAVLGAKIEVPTIKGLVSLNIPPHSTTGMRLRLKGRGIAARQAGADAGGNQYVVLKVMVPPGVEPALEAFLKDWVPSEAFDPRANMSQK